MKLTKEQKITIEKVLGFRPNRHLMLMILEEMQTGKDIYQACSKFCMPEMILLDDEEPEPPPEYPGQKRVIITGPHWKGGKK